MSIDPTRAPFVLQEFRFETVENLTVKATYPAARELSHLTHMDAASAATLATNLFNESSVAADAFKVIVEGTYTLNDIEGGPLRFILDMPTYATDGRTYKVTAFECDHMANRTTFEVRG